MKKPIILTFFCIFSYIVQSGERYNSVVFDSLEVKYDVIYGQSTTQGGVVKELKMDIFSPANDDHKNRPLIILAHGGFFTFGDKNWFYPVCEFLSKSGYVAATIQYRLIDVIGDSLWTPKRAVIDAVNDMKAAVRYFHKDVATLDEYGIDPDNIFIGGYSAGAILSLHYAYANSADDVLLMGGTQMLQYVLDNGGITGNSGNPSYSNKIKGVINIAGALYLSEMVNAGEPILYSVHGTKDNIVPYMKGYAGETLVKTEGSGLIHKKANKVGVINRLKTIGDGDHAAFWYCESCMAEMRQFIYENL